MMETRSPAEELLDGPIQDPEELAHSLNQVAAVNRWLGGERALRARLGHLLRPDRRFTILDVGCGNGTTLARLARWAARRCAGVLAVGVELEPETARIAADAQPQPVVRGDGLRLPFPDAAFDAVVATLTLHHFDDETAVSLVAEMRRVAEDVVLVNDLERHPLNYRAARLLALTWWRGNRLTRHDGPLSVLRSFTAPELLEIGRRARLEEPTVHRFFPWRLVLEGRP